MPRPANPRVRESLLDAGERLIHERGYNGVGVKEIVDTAGVPKGSFYSYFDSKEALVVEVVQRYWDAVEARHGALLEDEAAPPLERIRTFFAAMADDHELRKFTLGCLLGGMALELSNSSIRHAHDADRPLRPLGGRGSPRRLRWHRSGVTLPATATSTSWRRRCWRPGRAPRCAGRSRGIAALRALRAGHAAAAPRRIG